MTHYHRAFDKVVASDVPLRLLASCESTPPDVFVHWRDDPVRLEPSRGLFISRRMDKGYLIDIPFNRMVVAVDDAGTRLEVHPGTHEVDLADFGLAPLPQSVRGTRRLAADTLVTSVLAALPTLWGRVTVHSASLLTDRGVVLLCARSGWGKTTISQYLTRLGWQLLDDDSATVDQHLRLVPMGARPRLRQDAAAALGIRGEVLTGYAGGKQALAPPPRPRAYDGAAATFHLEQLPVDDTRAPLSVIRIPAIKALASINRSLVWMDRKNAASRQLRVEVSAGLACAPAFTVTYQRDVVEPAAVAEAIASALRASQEQPS